MTEFPETEEVQPPPPVRMSGQARQVLSAALRRWSGWNKATVEFKPPPPESGGFFAATFHPERRFYLNVDALTRNPHRVLRQVTPYRMRQEAVLTGAMLHEAGHARHSHWRPRTADQCKKFKHGFGSEHEGEEVNKPTLDLAALMEEARVEGLMNYEAGKIGALGMEWTMRAAAATLYPMPTLHTDPDRAIMDVITAYVLRAGRQMAYAHRTEYVIPQWVNDFQVLLHGAVQTYLEGKGVDSYDAGVSASLVMARIHDMVRCSDDTGTFMVDTAREVLDILFPETDPDDCPSPEGGCAEAGAGLPQHDLEGDDSPGEGEGEGEGGGISGDSDTEGDGEGEGEGEDTESPLAKALAELGEQADKQTEADAAVCAGEAPPPAEVDPTDRTGSGAGKGYADPPEGAWRPPTSAERKVKAAGETFLRSLIDPTVTRKVRTTSSPTSTIDAAAYAAWKANGQRTEPTFFRQIKRTITQAPPVKIAILRDVSASMDALTKPSALLAWSMAAAAYDLRNFAGRGVQIESCFINWGSSARVIQRNGEMLRGVFESPCNETTTALQEAFELVEEQMPGFFDRPEVPTSRLLIHFTDWRLGYKDGVETQVRALSNGVNTLSVVPRSWNARGTDWAKVMDYSNGIREGEAEVIPYDRDNPGQVWAAAQQMLNR